MTPIDPSSTPFSLLSAFFAPIQLTLDLLRVAVLCVKFLFEAAYEFFLGPVQDRVVTLVIDPNTLALSAEKRREMAQAERERFEKELNRNVSQGVGQHCEFDLVEATRQISFHEGFGMKQILHIQSGQDRNQMAEILLSVRLPKSQLAHFPKEICARLTEFDQETELQLYFVIYDASQIEGHTYHFFFHPLAYPEAPFESGEKKLSTGVFHSQNLEPVRENGASFGQFTLKTIHMLKYEKGCDCSPQNLRFKLDKPYGAFFTGAQLINDEGNHHAGVGVFGLVIRDWECAEASKMHHAAHEDSLKAFLEALKQSNFIFYPTVRLLFTYNENYYFTSHSSLDIGGKNR